MPLASWFLSKENRDGPVSKDMRNSPMYSEHHNSHVAVPSTLLRRQEVQNNKTQRIIRKPIGHGLASQGVILTSGSGTRSQMPDKQKMISPPATTISQPDKDLDQQKRSQVSTGSHHVHGFVDQEGLWKWIPHLQQSKDDNAIVQSVKAVFVNAEQFVNNFFVDCYYDQIKESLEAELETMIVPYLTKLSPLANLLTWSHQPTKVVNHCLVWMLLAMISQNPDEHYPSLLPPEFTTLAKALRRSAASEPEVPHKQSALAAHRVLMYYLRASVIQDESYLQARDKSIRVVIESFEAAFSLWHDKERSSPDRKTNMYELLVRAADLGVLLFSQASVFSFDWTVQSVPHNDMPRDGREIAISPRMVKQYDDNARELDPGLLMLQIKTVFLSFRSATTWLPESTRTRKTGSSTYNKDEVLAASKSTSIPVLPELSASLPYPGSIVHNQQNQLKTRATAVQVDGTPLAELDSAVRAQTSVAEERLGYSPEHEPYSTSRARELTDCNASDRVTISHHTLVTARSQLPQELPVPGVSDVAAPISSSEAAFVPAPDVTDGHQHVNTRSLVTSSDRKPSMSFNQPLQIIPQTQVRSPSSSLAQPASNKKSRSGPPTLPLSRFPEMTGATQADDGTNRLVKRSSSQSSARTARTRSQSYTTSAGHTSVQELDAQRSDVADAFTAPRQGPVATEGGRSNDKANSVPESMRVNGTNSSAPVISSNRQRYSLEKSEKPGFLSRVLNGTTSTR